MITVLASRTQTAPRPALLAFRQVGSEISWMMRLLVVWLLASCPARAAETEDLKREVELLRQQNREMLQKLQQQDRLIEQINQKLSTLETASTEPRSPAPVPISSTAPTEVPPVKRPLLGGLGKLHLSGEAGIALFHHQSEGQFPNAEMRVDEAKLFLETPVGEDIYFFTELNLFQRQDPSDRLNVGELYVDFENLSRFWHRDGQLGVRLGRIDIPFGEEYLTRDAIDNPLISNSLMDFWGVDEGLEAYGKVGGVHYVFAVQNGGHPSLRDYHPDKSLTLRVGYDPTSWLHLGASALRTGALDTRQDQLSELWFGNGFVRSLSTNAATFQAHVVQAEAEVRWKRGHVRGSAGLLRYTDSDPTQVNRRDLHFFSLEVLQQLTRKLYGITRFSRIITDRGFPLVGDGDFEEYFMDEMSKDLWRLSIGLGYRLNDHLLIKTEYSLNRGSEYQGPDRLRENLFALEAAVRF